MARDSIRPRPNAVEMIDVSVHGPGRILSKKGRELIEKDVGDRPAAASRGPGKRAWFSLNDEKVDFERILPSRALARVGPRVHSGTDPWAKPTSIRDPSPDYDTEPVMAFSAA